MIDGGKYEFTVGLKYWKSKVSYNIWEKDPYQINSGDYIFNPEEGQYKALPYTQLDLGKSTVSRKKKIDEDDREMTFYFSKINDEGEKTNKAII